MAPYVRDPADLHLGMRVRSLRKSLGVSQQELSDGTDTVFQQMQKYETGANRISASKLYQIAEFLRVPIDSFFDGFADDQAWEELEIQPERRARLFLATEEGVELARWCQKISSEHRRGLLALVRSLADTVD